MKKRNKLKDESALAEKAAVYSPSSGVRIAVAKTGVKRAVTITGSFCAGPALFPENPMIPLVLAEMLQEGTQKRTKKNLQKKLDSLGASIHFSASGKRFRFTVTALREHAAKALSILSEELLFPKFQQEKLARIQKQFEAGLALEAQNAKTQALIVFSRNIYPYGNANCSFLTEEKKKFLNSVTIESLKAFHKKFFRGTMYVAAAGDVEGKRFSRLFQKCFHAWPAEPVFPAVRVQSKKTDIPKKPLLVPLPGKSSIDVIIGKSFSVTKKHPDFYPLILASRVLGNPGFNGRLMKTVREKLGLTYGIYAYLSGFADNEEGGLYVWGTFAPQCINRGLRAIAKESALFLKKGVLLSEFLEHKQALLGAYALSFATSGGFAGALLQTLEDEKEISFLDEYANFLQSVTLADVNRVIKKYFSPKGTVRVLAGTFPAKGRMVV